MQVGMAEWSVAASCLGGRGFDPRVMIACEKPLGGISGPCKIAADRWYKTGICVSVSLVGRQPFSETGSPPSSRALLPATACLIACVAANDCEILRQLASCG